MRSPTEGLLARLMVAVSLMAGSAAFAPQASAANQVLACSPEKGNGEDTQVMITESMLSQGRILWPSTTGTITYLIKEKSPVSYLAAEDIKSTPRVASRLYINRLNGELQLELPLKPEHVVLLNDLCNGRITREDCARRLEGEDPSTRPACFAPINCQQLGGATPAHPVVQAAYKCRRSFKKF